MKPRVFNILVLVCIIFGFVAVALSLVNSSNVQQASAVGCVKSSGDADCNGRPMITDYAIWRIEFLGGCSSTTLTNVACSDDKDSDGNLMDADFNGDSKVSLADYQIWKQAFILGETLSPSPSPTPTVTVQGTLYTATLLPDGNGSTHSGQGSILVAPDQKSAKVTLTSTLDSTGEITAEHIHGPGPNPDQYDVQLFPLTPGTQTINTSNLTAGQWNDLQTGKWYFNVHTRSFDAGEIRGIIHLVAAP